MGWKGQGKRVWLAGLLVLVVTLAAAVGSWAVRSEYASDAATGRVLPWHVVAPPTGLHNLYQMEVSPADGHIAWVCGLVAANTFAVWRTADAGGSWRKAGQVSAPTLDGSVATDCQVRLDQNGTDDVALNTFDLASNGPVPMAVSYVTTDGGATWHGLPQGTTVLALASQPTRLYALLATATTLGYTSPHLVTSTDDLKTWSDVPYPGGPGAPAITQIYSAPGADGVIVTLNKDLIHLSNDGTTWTPIAPPTTSSPPPAILLINWLAASHTWMVCEQGDSGGTPTLCTTDGGHTWKDRPLLPNLWMCPGCNGTPQPAVNGGMCLPGALAGDGSLLALCWTKINPTNPDEEPGSPTDPAHLYRLGPTASTWTDLGVMGGGQGSIVVAGHVVWNMGGPVAWATDLPETPR